LIRPLVGNLSWAKAEKGNTSEVAQKETASKGRKRYKNISYWFGCDLEQRKEQSKSILKAFLRSVCTNEKPSVKIQME
jgi:hypothetical protein